jgi:hypothetical protein
VPLVATSTKLGADPDALDRLSSSLQKVSTHLRAVDRDVLGVVRSTNWQGPSADRFRTGWPGTSGASLRSAADTLAKMAGDLKRQAEDQRRVSATLGGGAALPGGAAGPPPDPLKQWAATEGRAGIERASSLSAEDQRIWWGALTPEQQQALLRNQPGRLTGLSGLDPAVRAEAERQYWDQKAKDIKVRKETTTLQAGGRFKVYKVIDAELGVKGSSSLTEYRDGSATVGYGVDPKTAAQLGLKAQSGEGGGAFQLNREQKFELVYRFANVAEAEAFQKGLLEEVVPSGNERLLAAVPFIGAADAAADGVGYLKDHASKLESASIGVSNGAAITAGFPGFSIDESGAVSAKHDLKSGVTTLAYRGGAAASADLGLEGIRGSGEVRAELTLNQDLAPTKLTVTGQLEGTAGLNPGPFTFHEGARGTFSAALDLTDPRVREAAQRYLEDVSHGRFDDAGRELGYLVSQGDLSASLDHVDIDKLGKDLGVVYASGERTTVTNQVLLARPPGGDWVRHDGP